MFELINYFISQLIFYLKDFIKTYIIGVFDFFANNYWDKIIFLDRITNFSINIRYFWVPLWRYYSFAAYIVSIPIRIFKILMGGIVICIFSVIYWALYGLWLLIPIILIIKIFK